MFNRSKLAFHYLLPKQCVTRLAGWCATKRMGWLTRLVIRLFIRFYHVDMSQAQHPDVASYPTFNDFFTRPLREDARIISQDKRLLTIPADGVISQLGKIEQGVLLQAKGQSYSLEALLAGNHLLAQQFLHGEFITIYLSPKDYHRVHMPCDGVLREMISVPGQLFSVSPFTTQHIPNLFARNERVICLFDTEFGPLVQILVGATIVGSIETLWMGTITPPREGIIKRYSWPDAENDQSVVLHKGQQMARFKLGSTVITLLAPDKASLLPQLHSAVQVEVGQPLAQAVSVPQEQDLN